MRDELPRRPTPGLSEAVSEFFFEELESLDKTDGKRCPGEDVCSSEGKDSGPLYANIARRMNRPVETVCGECPKVGTKPDRHSPHLGSALSLAGHLDELKAAGATFSYPEAFTNPFWWACLKAAHRGRTKHETESAKREKDRRKKEAEEFRRKQQQARNGR